MKKFLQITILVLAAVLMLPTGVQAYNQMAEGAYSGIRGDANGDGEVNPVDISALINYLLNGSDAINTRNADTNNDGVITPADISMLIDYLLGNVPTLEGETYTVNGVSFKMIPVEGGTFMMGESGWATPVHQVTLSDYSIGQTEVTQELWQAVMGSNPSWFNGTRTEYQEGEFGVNLQRPVECVSWYDCQVFTAKLNQLTGKNFRLPTEAEWEFAARGGNKSQGYTYAGSEDIDEVAWYGDNSGNVTHTVATKAPNELGLYDMSGNVWERCNDFWANYSSEAQTNPTGPETGSYSVGRGNGWSASASLCHVSFRGSCRLDYRSNFNGLRLVCSDTTVTAVPVITTEVETNAVTVSVIGSGAVTLYVNGEAVDNPHMAIRGDEDYTITAYATAQLSGKEMSQSKEQTITIPARIDLSENSETFTVNGVSFTMVSVEGGTFMMGAEEQDSEARDNERPVHQVTLSDYSIGQTEVTQELWQAVMGSNPSWFNGRRIVSQEINYGTNLQRPVEYVTWEECQQFIAELNRLTGKTFRMPTEAEWEYAARGGNKSQHYKYAGSNNIDEVAWYTYNSYSITGRDFITQTVATKKANELGLYDMTGNVWEYCQDYYDSYSSVAQTNPTGLAYGYEYVLRGGSLNDYAKNCRVSYRNHQGRTTWSSSHGLRLALSYATFNPVITTEIEFESVKVTAMGAGNVTLYINGVAEDNPYIAIRGDEDYTITATVVAQVPGREMLQFDEQVITIPARKVIPDNSETFTVNGVSFTMVGVDGGTFMMGRTGWNFPGHQVTLSSYGIGMTQVTQELWEAVMGENPSHFNGGEYGTNLQRPVESVSWDDCQTFIQRLNELTGQHFRLPTEAEWEYAAYGGNLRHGYKYAGSNNIDEVAWWGWLYDGNSGYGTNPVANKKPNELGLYDMSGNVFEWCQDWYGDYSSEEQTNPTGPETGTNRVDRGGNWRTFESYCGVVFRASRNPENRGDDIGLRLAL